MTSDHTIDVQTFISTRRISSLQVMVLALCFLVVAVDGFDTAAVGYIAPALRTQWHVTPSELAPLFGAGLLGLMVGAFFFGPLADKMGRRSVLIFAIASFGLTSILSVTAPNIEVFTVWRFATGLGLGGAMPCATTLTSEYCPERHRSVLVIAIFSGFTLGGALGGVSAAVLIADFGWKGVLILGGALPLVLALILTILLPESVRYLVQHGGKDRRVAAILRRIDPTVQLDSARFVGARPSEGFPVRQLFTRELMGGTLLLWIAFFMGLLVFYLLTSWLPMLLNGAGQSASAASLVSVMLPVGSTLGALAIGLLMDRLNPHMVLACSFTLGAGFISLLGLSMRSPWLLLLAVFGAGIGTGGSQIGVNALAASFYPTASRATGVSWVHAIGRIGAIVGSILGGILMSFGWDLFAIFSIAALPALIAGVAMLSKAFLREGTRTEVVVTPAPVADDRGFANAQ